jgi:hypothetical protein
MTPIQPVFNALSPAIRQGFGLNNLQTNLRPQLSPDQKGELTATVLKNGEVFINSAKAKYPEGDVVSIQTTGELNGITHSSYFSFLDKKPDGIYSPGVDEVYYLEGAIKDSTPISNSENVLYTATYQTADLSSAATTTYLNQQTLQAAPERLRPTEEDQSRSTKLGQLSEAQQAELTPWLVQLSIAAKAQREGK